MIRPYQPSDCQTLALCDPNLNSHHTFLWLSDQKVLGILLISSLDSDIFIHHYELDETIKPDEGMHLLVEDLKQIFGHEDIYFLHQ